MYRKFGKRWCDVAMALALLVLALPLLALVAVALYLFQSGEVFFRQERPGLGGKVFQVLKFKSMRDRRPEEPVDLSDAQRTTVAGRIVRATSLDELPQLWNVLCGDMSLVGPRPLLVEYLPLYSARQARRHEVRPGLTGLAQVCGRNLLSWEEKFELDVEYVDRLSIALDLWILGATFIKLFTLHGVNAAAGVTMERFRGTKGGCNDEHKGKV